MSGARKADSNTCRWPRGPRKSEGFCGERRNIETGDICRLRQIQHCFYDFDEGRGRVPSLPTHPLRVWAEGKKRMQHLRITILSVYFLRRLWVSKGEKENVPVVCFPAVGDRAHPVKNGNGEKAPQAFRITCENLHKNTKVKLYKNLSKIVD